MILFKYLFLLFSGVCLLIFIFESTINIKKFNTTIISPWSLHIAKILIFSIIFFTVIEYLIRVRKINYFISIISFLIFISGFLLRIWSKKTLGEFYSHHLQLNKTHRLISSGPYKWIRHPYYLAIILEMIGFTLIPNAYFSFCFGTITMVPLLMFRSNKEEDLLRKNFKNDFVNYYKRTDAFFPFKLFLKGKTK